MGLSTRAILRAEPICVQVREAPTSTAASVRTGATAAAAGAVAEVDGLKPQGLKRGRDLEIGAAAKSWLVIRCRCRAEVFGMLIWLQ